MKPSVKVILVTVVVALWANLGVLTYRALSDSASSSPSPVAGDMSADFLSFLEERTRPFQPASAGLLASAPKPMASPAGSAPRPLEAPNIVLRGIVMDSTSPQAIVSPRAAEGAAGGTKTVGAGDGLGDVSIREIKSDHIVVEQSGRRYLVYSSYWRAAP